MIIPIESIEAEVLYRIAEEFVTREGTDYGEVELSHSAKVSELLEKLKCGDVLVLFDQELETVNLVNKQDYDSSLPLDS